MIYEVTPTWDEELGEFVAECPECEGTGLKQRIAELEAENERWAFRNGRHVADAARVRALVSAQAEDEGLWFVACTASEAYLQQELRRLHAAIEGPVLNQGIGAAIGEVKLDPDSKEARRRDG